MEALPSTGRRGRRVWVHACEGPVPAAWDTVLGGLGAEAIHVEDTHLHDIPDDGILLVWHGAGFESALSWLEARTPRPLRSRVVLAAPGEAPRDLGPRLRKLGGLTWWHAPWAPWVIEVARTAIARDATDAASTLEDLEHEAMVRPSVFLTAVADTARRALHADHAEVLCWTEDAPPQRLVEHDNGAKLVSPRVVEALPPQGLAQRTWDLGELVVVPHIEHARIAHGGAWGAAVSVPVRARSAAVDTPNTVLQVYWREPLLPTPGELQVVRTLVTAAGIHQARVAEHELLTRAHIASVEALTRGSLGGTGPEATTEVDLVHVFAKTILQARSLVPGLQAFFARLSTSSRAATPARAPWRHIQRSGVTTVARSRVEPLEALAATIGSGSRPAPVSWGRDEWLQAAPLRTAEGSRPLGHVVAQYRSRTSAETGHAELRRLAADLVAGILQLRRARDAQAMHELAQILARATHAKEALASVAGLIARSLSADGVKVFELTEGHDHGWLTQLYRTDRENGGHQRTEVTHERGLANWVVLQDSWLVLEHPSDAEGGPLQPVQARTKQQRTVQITPRPAAEFWEGHHPDKERVQLLVPLRHAGRVAGVLGVWRTTPEPFDDTLDVEAMLAFAPHVASACARLSAMRLSEHEAKAIGELARKVMPSVTLAEVSHHVLHQAATLSKVHFALLFRHDSERPGWLSAVELWASGPPSKRLRRRFLNAHVHWGTDTGRWRHRCAELVHTQGVQDTQLHVHQFVVLPNDDARWPVGAVALLTVVDRPASVPLLAEEATRATTDSLLQYGGLLIGQHPRVHATAVVERLARHDLANTAPLEAAAAVVAELITDATVLVSTGPASTHKVTAASPRGTDVIGTRVQVGWLTQAPQPEPRRVTNFSLSGPVQVRAADHTFLSTVQERLDWSGVGSWLGVPVCQGQHILGVLHLLTPAGGTVLLEDHTTVVRAVARWAAEEEMRTRRRQMLEELNQIASRLAGTQPTVLARELPIAVQRWARRYLDRSTEVAVVARSGRQHDLLHGATKRAVPELERLRTLSRARRGLDFHWARNEDVPQLDKLPKRVAGVAAALQLAGDSSLEGHIYFLHKRDFSTEDIALIEGAARELSVLLHGEVVRHEWKLQAGLFRHALLGPAQGLQSAARLVHKLAVRDDPNLTKLDAARDRILHEVELLRLWRETQRLYTEVQEGRTPDIRARSQSLRRVVDRVMERYEAALRVRNIDLHLDWGPPGGLHIPFDRQVLDLILSNLLDNAGKYTFYNRDITVRVAREGDVVAIEVEDFGRGIPNELQEQIYLPGTRAGGRDPMRAIAGQGLGLFLARALARAHGGDLTHTSVPDGVVAGDKQPHRVIFRLTLPHHWGRS